MTVKEAIECGLDSSSDGITQKLAQMLWICIDQRDSWIHDHKSIAPKTVWSGTTLEEVIESENKALVEDM